MSKRAEAEDFFAAMAAGMDSGASERPDMEAVPAPALPDQRLADESAAGLTPPSAHDKLDSPEKLAARLAELHAKYDPELGVAGSRVAQVERPTYDGKTGGGGPPPYLAQVWIPPRPAGSMPWKTGVQVARSTEF